jgi:hypothetical protein
MKKSVVTLRVASKTAGNKRHPTANNNNAMSSHVILTQHEEVN